MKKETESGEDEIKPKLRRKPTELDSDDDEDTVDDVKPLKQVCIEMTDSFKFKCWKSFLLFSYHHEHFSIFIELLDYRRQKLVFSHHILPQR